MVLNKGSNRAELGTIRAIAYAKLQAATDNLRNDGAGLVRDGVLRRLIESVQIDCRGNKQYRGSPRN